MTYLIYGTFAPSGAMQNHRASNGAYLYWVQNFMGAGKSYQLVYRPMFKAKEESLPLYQYTKKIEALRKEESADLVEGVHHPTMWH